jgi:ankyrin repeat protein
VTRKIILGSCLLLVLCIFWVAWPKTNVWNEIMNGETEAVRMRIETGFDVNSICPGVDTLTLGEKWKYLSEFEWPPKEYKQLTAMSIAVEEKHPGMVQLLVDNGADWPSARSIIGLGEKNLAKRCIQQGGRLHLDDLKYTDRAGLVGWLIEQDLELGIDKNILLHWAALNGDAKAVESLIKRGADSKNALVTNGHTPLHAAAFGSHDYEEKKRKLENRAAIIRQLIASGADVNAKSICGETPVDWAFGVEGLYQPLREHGGKPGNYITILSKTRFRPDNPMMYGSPNEPDFKEQLDQYEKFENEMAILIREIAADGHDINAPVTNINTGRDYYGERDYWKLTVDEDKDGDGVSDFAEEEAGTDPYDSDDIPTPETLAELELNLRTSPLFTALNGLQSAKIISLLIELGANVNVSEKQTGDTPLHLASEYPTSRVAEVLITNGVNVNALNKEDETPLDIRIEHPGISGFMPSGYNTTDTPEETEEDQLVTLLRKHGAKTGDELIEEGQ